MTEYNIECIKIKPERQRKDLGDLTDLKNSLTQVGLINPIVIEPAEIAGTFYLIAGERRFTAWTQLAQAGKVRPFIQATLLSDLDEATRQLIELEENIKRKDLTWQEQISAIAKIYYLKDFQNMEEAGTYLGMSDSNVSKALQVYNNLSNPKVAQAPNYSAAYTIVQRENARALDNMSLELNSFFKNAMQEEILNDTATDIISQGTEGSLRDSQKENHAGEASCSKLETAEGLRSQPGKCYCSPYEIRQGDFIQFAQSYKGEPFDLIHLDFPYGINHDRSKQGNTANFGTYEDSEDVYKTLVKAFLENQDRLVAEKAHCICWLSLRFLEWTKEAFAQAGWACHMQPLIWHKSDNKGIIADVQCGFRNVCEYALFFVRGRKAVVKNISNLYSGPTTKRFHASEKPLPMLKYFFSGLCDRYSRVLDPTCGSGTAIMAAEYYGAQEALGLELDPDFAAKANEWLLIESAKNPTDIDISLEI